MRVGLLGSIRVSDGDSVVEVPGTKQRALLALLAVHAGAVVSDDLILEELWGEALPDNPANALQKRVSELRKLLGADRVVRRGEGYLLDLAPADVDSLAFEQQVGLGRERVAAGRVDEGAAVLAAALGLWRGPALSELADLSFARAEAARLDELRWAAVEDRVAADLDLGRHHELAGELAALVAEQPLRERLRGELMLALYRAGRQADALRAYSGGREVLAEELGLDPGPELRALEAAILAQDPSLAAPAVVARGRGEVPGNLPAPVTTFVGREKEIAVVAERLASHRLVTLTGPGGAGKTRLALEVVRSLVASTPDGVWLVELAPVPGPTAVVATVAAAVGAREAGSDSVPPLDRLIAHLRDREAVVVLDNCEHVLDAAASVTSAVLAAGAGMRIVATSREPLGIAGEAQVPVPTLELAAAARLFADRAAAVRPDFDADAAEVSRVCEQLDGLPLAIELAAARVKALPVEQIAARLQDRFRLLSGGARDAAERHRTLRAAVEWSYDLLFDDEQRAFCALAVFPGTFDLDAAEAVCEAVGLEGADVVDLVAHLVDKSLVITDGGRYRMLETLRRFGLERVADAARHAHASFFLAVAEDALPATFGAGQLASLDRVDREHDNFRAALDFLIAAEPARAVQLAGALAWPWWLRGHRQEARHVLDVALEAAGDDADAIVRCRALRWAGYLVSATGWAGVLRSPEEEQALAHQRCQAAIALAGAAGDRAELAHARRQLAVTLTRDVAYGGIEQLDAIAELLGASIAIFEELGDKWGVGAAHVVLAYAGLATGDVAMATRAVAHARLALAAAGERFALARLAGAEAMLAELGGDVDGAAGHYRDGLAVARELGLGDVVAAFATQLTRLAGDAVTAVDGAEQLSPDHAAAEAAMRNRLGEAAFAEGDLDRAEEQHRQALELYREHGMADGVSASLFRLAEVAEARGSADR